MTDDEQESCGELDERTPTEIEDAREAEEDAEYARLHRLGFVRATED